MRTIEIDAAAWETQQDFIEALKVAIGAPDWHGSNFIAFGNSMIGGGINALKPPYVIRVVNADHLPREVIDVISIFSVELDRARSRRRFRTDEDVPVALEFDRVAALGTPTAIDVARLIVAKRKHPGNVSLPRISWIILPNASNAPYARAPAAPVQRKLKRRRVSS